MGNIRKSKKDTLSEVQKKLTSILSGLVKHECDAELYICDLAIANEIEELDKILYPLRSETIRGKAYDINKLVNIINPNEPAYDFSIVKVYKYQYIKDKIRCLARINVQMDISHNFQRKALKELIEINEFSENYIKEITSKLEKQLEEEKEVITNICKNPDDYDILISGYLEKVEYEQINFGVKRKINKMKKGKEITLEKIRLNRHLSIKKPNVIIYHPDIEEDNQRADMEVKYLEKKGYKLASRGIFYRKKK
jgi:hypothetical protein